ncbi:MULTISPECIES: tryptophan 2,3-dioxygenase family protein [unclassified Mucilaginibacter]|uniref:tryptophan 2,3-dioxygenase family protein n=1 Tax=unclassified Mucilaginibacter TaxID=2617802 RepID=UPI002AC93D08|nr:MULTISPECIES: tryptophan 2,3-dioxygenase family protein [unclassified Mucilaginibacter]MEB0264006.1 tryptophan 2,3-dioxygenase family protein [Mucilaginibacter sp. 10I4]MEB0278542.1 tryptophan 2,3-dioxygenase family protein [Mucilaginibacter sp. 10B2]MEB0299253.1 tryptophan 2,3-dioxygenase family protein [Mucilaginibacter sp. 5C4]WPX23502.1 tryptophan 2,3-dioxygenase family protein [Mucilaginibacter sp. 5C4]
MSISPEIEKRLTLLQEKYNAMGQDMTSYLDGLLHADFLTYWDYIHLDTLLSLQSPKTPFPDEEIFIMYHQITELYFKLSLHECKQISEHENLTVDFFTARIKRINRYFEALTNSFEIMVDGMEKEQFLQFRMSLLPASGFQSGQYRLIEIYATDFINLVAPDHRQELAGAPVEDQFEQIYWKYGATELSTGKRTLTLNQFEKKYAKTFIELGKQVSSTNFNSLLQQFKYKGKSTNTLEEQLRQLDVNVNVNWPLSHYKSAVRYLHREPEEIKATGGTNWQKYLPPRFQRRIFYPSLWSAYELENWGKAWVDKVVSQL